MREQEFIFLYSFFRYQALGTTERNPSVLVFKKLSVCSLKQKSAYFLLNLVCAVTHLSVEKLSVHSQA